jgi:hypothetical protein
MFIELVDALRCTREHPDTWLVASIVERDDRIIRTGALGCPICSREYPIRGGVAWFGVEAAVLDDAPPTLGADAGDDAMLLGAMLEASEGATIAVTGRWARAAIELVGMLPMRAYVINPDVTVADSERTGVIRSAEGIPLAPNALRGVALDDANATPENVASAIRALAAGGRLVAPAAFPVPQELVELARDERWWVAEKPRPLVGLRRG